MRRTCSPGARARPRPLPALGLLAAALPLVACQRKLPQKIDEDAGITEPGLVGADGADGGGAGVEGPAVLAEGALLSALLSALPRAERRIWTAQYTLWDGQLTGQVYRALEAAAARGVEVRVLADEEAEDTPARLAALSAAGAQTRLDDPGTTTHHKLWIIDDQLITGSHNLSDSGLGRNAELSAATQAPELVEAAAARFDALWADPAARPAAAAPPDPARPAQLYVDDEALGGLLHCVDTAVQRVDLAIYAVAWDDRYPGSGVDLLLGALERAQARGLAVRVLLDDSDWVRDNDINDAAFARLVAAGVPTRRADPEALVHAKVLICDDTLLASDANWSYSGLDLYHGATLALRDAESAAAGRAFVDGLWAAGSAR
ncbi:MAG: hypothetical protein RL071_2157 [Pseudomonadota bacterium]